MTCPGKRNGDPWVSGFAAAPSRAMRRNCSVAMTKPRPSSKSSASLVCDTQAGDASRPGSSGSPSGPWPPGAWGKRASRRVPEARHRVQLIGVVGIDPRPGPARRGAPKDLAGSFRATTLCPRGAQRTTPVEGRQRAAGQTFDPQHPLLRAQQTRMFRLGFSPVLVGGGVLTIVPSKIRVQRTRRSAVWRTETLPRLFADECRP